MTDKEKAIVMAYTGICMLAGDKFRIFHRYVEDIMGRPVYTHEIGLLADAIKEKAEADFMALCADESSSENPNKRFSGMTNGEVIQALFPYIKVETYERTTSVKWLDCDKGAVDPYSYFWSKWWNASYKVESEE